MAIDKRVNFKGLGKSKKLRVTNAIVWLKNHDFVDTMGAITVTASTTGGRYQRYVNWYANTEQNDYTELKDYTLSYSEDTLTTSDEIVSVTFTNTAASPAPSGQVTVTPSKKIHPGNLLEVQSFLNSLFAHSLDGSLAIQLINFPSSNLPVTYGAFNVVKNEVIPTEFNVDISSSKCPFQLDHITLKLNGTNVDVAFSGIPSTPENKWKISPADTKHANAAFLPWHRVLLRLFELDLKVADEELGEDGNISLPYWDWFSDNSETSYLWKDQLHRVGEDGDEADNNKLKTGPFKYPDWKIYHHNGTMNVLSTIDYVQRELGRATVKDALNPVNLTLENVKDPWSMPTKEDEDKLKNIPIYDLPPYNEASSHMSFRNVLEGWHGVYTNMRNFVNQPAQFHNAVHLWVGGTMANAKLAINDPIFFLHMANVDRVWWEWQKEHSNPPELQYPMHGPLPGTGRFDPMLPWKIELTPLTITPAMVLSTDWSDTGDPAAVVTQAILGDGYRY